MFCNLFIQDSSTQMEHLVFSKVLPLLPNFPAGLTEAQGSQLTSPGQTASVARNRLEPTILLALYPTPDHAPFYELFCTRDKLCPLFLLVYRYFSNTPSFIYMVVPLLNTGLSYLEVIKIPLAMPSSLISPAVQSLDPSLELNDLANISTSGVHISFTISLRKKECNSFATCALSNFNCY